MLVASGVQRGFIPLAFGAFSATRSVAEKNALISYGFSRKAAGAERPICGQLCHCPVRPKLRQQVKPMKENRARPAAPLRPERSRLISQGELGRRALQRHVLGNGLHIPQDRRIENPGIVAGHLRIGMAEHLGDVFNGRAACERQGRERVPRGVGR